MKKILFTFLTIVMALVANAQIEFRQSNTSLVWPQDPDQVITGVFAEEPVEGNLLLAFLGARTGTTGLFTPTEDMEGWELLADAIGGGRNHVYYKWAKGAVDTLAAFSYSTDSQFTLILAEFSGVESIDTESIVTNIPDEGNAFIEVGPVSAVAGQVAIASIAVRALTLLVAEDPGEGEDFEVRTELSWTDDFIMIGDTTANPWGPITAAVAYRQVTADGSINTEVSWETDQTEVQPSGIMLLLNPKTDTPISSAEITYQQSRVAYIYPDDDPIVRTVFDNEPTPGNLLIALLGARTGGSGHFTPADGYEGWEFFADAINSGGGRKHVFYKFAEVGDTAVSFTTTVKSQYYLMLIEFSGVESIVDGSEVVTTVNQQSAIELGPIQVQANQAVIATFAGRNLNLLESEFGWTDDFIAVLDTTANPASPVAGALAYYIATEDGVLSTEAFWDQDQTDVNSAGMLFLLQPKTDATSVIESNLSAIEVYPIPASNRLNIRNLNSPSQLSIFNITGQIMARYYKVENDVSIDVSSFPPGIYILNVIENSGNRISKKLIIE